MCNLCRIPDAVCWTPERAAADSPFTGEPIRRGYLLKLARLDAMLDGLRCRMLDAGNRDDAELIAGVRVEMEALEHMLAIADIEIECALHYGANRDPYAYAPVALYQADMGDLTQLREMRKAVERERPTPTMDIPNDAVIHVSASFPQPGR